MVEEAMTCPFPFTASRAFVRPVKAKFVVVAEVVVARSVVNPPKKVDEAVMRSP